MDYIKYFANGGFERSEQYRKKQEQLGKTIREKVGTYVIDSCNTWDEGYETAIWNEETGKPTVIVERYKTYEDMEKGHKKWCKFCEENPKQVYSVQLGEIEEL